MNAEQQFLDRMKLHTGTWMEHPDIWQWTTPDGRPQGFGYGWRNSVGLSNLLWLSLDMSQPPDRAYDMRHHNLCVMVIQASGTTDLAGLSLREQAESLTLEQFHRLGQEQSYRAASPVALLTLLAERRIRHANA